MNKRRKTDKTTAPGMRKSGAFASTQAGASYLGDLAPDENEAMSLRVPGRDASSARRQKRMAMRRPGLIEAGEVYCVEQSPSNGAVIIVPIFQEWSSHRAKLLGTAEREGFFQRETHRFDPVPTFCIDYDAEAETAGGWKVGYTDGGDKVSERKYPVVLVCGERYTTASTKRTWVAGKDILTYEPSEVAANEVAGVNDYQNQMDAAKKAEAVGSQGVFLTKLPS